MEALFECTLEMLNKDLEEFPEHRQHFFRMLQSFTIHCFPGTYRNYNNETTTTSIKRLQQQTTTTNNNYYN